MSKSINELSTSELRELLYQKTAEENLRINNENCKKCQWVVANVDILLQLYPKHTFADCSDQKPKNNHSCNRCRLLYVKENNYSEYYLDLLFVEMEHLETDKRYIKL